MTVTFPSGTGLERRQRGCLRRRHRPDGRQLLQRGQGQSIECSHVQRCGRSTRATRSGSPSASVTNPSSAGALHDRRLDHLDTTPVTSGEGGDTVPPVTVIDSGPAGSTGDSTPTFSFSSSEPGSSFQCRVDSAPFAPCTSPFTTPALPDGAHTFEVKATDPAGNPDASPASRAFTVDTVPPPIDTDGDGVFDPSDACPTVPASTPNGCPATPHRRDRCKARPWWFARSAALSWSPCPPAP